MLNNLLKCKWLEFILICILLPGVNIVTAQVVTSEVEIEDTAGVTKIKVGDQDRLVVAGSSISINGNLVINDDQFIYQYSSYKYGGRWSYYTSNPSFSVRYGHNFDHGSAEINAGNASVVSTAYFYPGSTSWGFASDRRLKRDISPIQDALSKVMKVPSVSFSYKSDETSEKKYGFIAQEIQQIAPELVQETTNEGGKEFLTLEKGDLIAILWNAVRELKEETDDLRKQNDELAIEVKAMKNKDAKKSHQPTLGRKTNTE